jgi:hypothetical protein
MRVFVLYTDSDGSAWKVHLKPKFTATLRPTGIYDTNYFRQKNRTALFLIRTDIVLQWR